MKSCRTKSGGRIDRAAPIEFSFAGRSYSGFKGDTLASALLANGVHFVGRSYKYHRPRGIFSAGVEEPCALVGIDRGEGRVTPNTRATTQELYKGLAAEAQHCWPSLHWDIGELNRLGGSVIAAGFFYKTFMWPRSFWEKVYEPVIRKAAGLGKAPSAPDPDRYAARYAHCDVLIIGAGPAGLAAALAASKAGKKTILVDEQAEPGGELLSSPNAMIDGRNAWDWLAETLARLQADDNIIIVGRTTAFGYYNDNFVGLSQRLSEHLASKDLSGPRERLWRVRAKRVILATGAIERPLVFGGNDRPGIMLAGAARTYLGRYGVVVGKRPVVVTSHDSAYDIAFALAREGAKVGAIVDLRSGIAVHLRAEATKLGIEILLDQTIVNTGGRKRVSFVEVAPVAGEGASGTARKIPCDVVLMSGGWTPSVHLFSQSRGSLVWSESLGAPVPGDYAQEGASAGACNGQLLLSEALNNGAATAGETKNYEVDGEAFVSGTSIEAPRVSGSKMGSAFVDFQHDVTTKDIELAVREGFHSIEHIKRYTTTGMATDQGKTSNINGVMVASDALGQEAAKVGLTTFRPPYTPTTFGALAGYKRKELYEPVRKTPIDTWAENNSAVFEPVGQWRRARYFPQKSEDMDAAVARECSALRERAGMVDVSTLGKIEVTGADAGEFLNRLYTGNMAGLGVGRCRYGLMLGEDGFIYDDGVVARLDEHRFHVTTTSGGAARVFTALEDYRQTEWPELNVWQTSVTEQWAAMALGGPLARKILAPHVQGIDLAKDAFPHMAVRQGTICGVPMRLFRISFTGELGFEINVPARFGLLVWERLIKAGAAFGLEPYGTEAIHVLRAEKGYIIVGQDTEGSQTPDDVGMGWAVARKKPDFVGKRALARTAAQAGKRKQLVGLLSKRAGLVLEEGAQIVDRVNPAEPGVSIGHVTSCYWSEALGRSIALALVSDGRARIGSPLFVPGAVGGHEVEVVEPVFYDPEGERFNG